MSSSYTISLVVESPLSEKIFRKILNIDRNPAWGCGFFVNRCYKCNKWYKWYKCYIFYYTYFTYNTYNTYFFYFSYLAYLSVFFVYLQ